MSEPEGARATSLTRSPLPDRMRPRSLDDFAGQEHLVGEGRVLRRLIQSHGTLPSLILWGPPGTGKTTLARLLADQADARFVALSSGGDARVALAALEAAVESTKPDDNGQRVITNQTLVEALGRAQFAYDKGGEEHYNLASALIKSLRNSDVNAALYWLARMIE